MTGLIVALSGVAVLVFSGDAGIGDGGRPGLSGLLALLGGALYANTLVNDFVWDDRLTAAPPAGVLAVTTQRTPST